jgi:hypothetical protein
MNSTQAQLSHIAFLVPSVARAALVARELGFHAGPAQAWEGEGTLEVYVGQDLQNGRLLLMEGAQEGAYNRAMKKRGPGLHHIAINVRDLESYVRGISGSSWLLHPKSLESIKNQRTAYLARPGIPTLIEVQEPKEIFDDPMFVQELALPFSDQHMQIVRALGIRELVLSNDQSCWLTCDGRRFPASRLWT